MRPSRVRPIRWLAAAFVTLAGCATAAEDGSAEKKDAAADLGEETDDPNGGGGDGSIFPTEDADSVEDTGTVEEDGGPTPKDSGTSKDSGAVDGGAPGCTVVESFESGTLSAWKNSSTGGVPTFSSTSAHDGSKGVNSSAASGWFYRTTPSVGKAGDRIFAWVRGTGGRVYLGFSASSAGAKSFVIAPNTGDIRFQDNVGWAYKELTTKATSFIASHWYKAEIVFGASGTVTGNLYDTDGKTLLSTVTHPFGSVAIGGLALRVWALDVDTITVCPAP